MVGMKGGLWAWEKVHRRKTLFEGRIKTACCHVGGTEGDVSSKIPCLGLYK